MTVVETGDLLAWRRALAEAGVLRPTTEPGIYGRSGRFEAVVAGLTTAIRALGGVDDDHRLTFAPVMARADFERTGYVRSFPDMLGSVTSFAGSDRDHARLLATFEAGGDWTAELSPTEVTLCSAACHPLYPLLTGELPSGGATYEVLGTCFRHEPSPDPARMQSFHQLEFVRIGSPDVVLGHRDTWVERGRMLLTELGLEPEVVVANDPFFGRAGRLLAASQRQQALKLELVCEIGEAGHGVAVSSGNIHGDHFTHSFDIRIAGDEPAQTACIGFGLERISLALLWQHGLDPADWPAQVRGRLWP